MSDTAIQRIPGPGHERLRRLVALFVCWAPALGFTSAMGTQVLLAHLRATSQRNQGQRWRVALPPQSQSGYRWTRRELGPLNLQIGAGRKELRALLRAGVISAVSEPFFMSGALTDAERITLLQCNRSGIGKAYMKALNTARLRGLALGVSP